MADYRGYLYFALFGYFCGSVLFGLWIPRLLKGIDVRDKSEDRNPGAANTFMHAGIGCGILVLVCDILKGLIPVALACRYLDVRDVLFGIVLVAPVFGHVFPLFQRFRGGGKGIAVTFGVMLGLYPYIEPAGLLAFWYLFFSLILVLRPHTFRTVTAYFCWIVSGFFLLKNRAAVWGIAGITAIVLTRHRKELREKREKNAVRFLFRRK